MSDTPAITEPSLDGRPHSCGGTFRLTRELGDVRIRGTVVRVPREFFRCDGCQDERASLGQISAERRLAADRLREQEAILSPAEIRQLRESFGLSQAEFERALGLGPKTVVRWETGKVMPNQATSELLLLLKRDPSAISFLAARRGMNIAVATTIEWWPTLFFRDYSSDVRLSTEGSVTTEGSVASSASAESKVIRTWTYVLQSAPEGAAPDVPGEALPSRVLESPSFPALRESMA